MEPQMPQGQLDGDELCEAIGKDDKGAGETHPIHPEQRRLPHLVHAAIGSQAAQPALHVVIFDEIDAVLRRRGGPQEGGAAPVVTWFVPVCLAQRGARPAL